MSSLHMREPYLSPCDDPMYCIDMYEGEIDEDAELDNIFDEELYPDLEEAL